MKWGLLIQDLLCEEKDFKFDFWIYKGANEENPVWVKYALPFQTM